MNLIQAEFTGRALRTADVESFRFTTEEKINFLPGQFLRLIFDEVDTGNRELNKYLSFSCSPSRGYIEVTKRLSSSRFSERLKGLKQGDRVLIQAPLGNCTFNPEYVKIGFIVGGIGITPVISIMESIVYNNLSTDAALFYSNKTEGDIAFKLELDSWSAQKHSIKVFHAITDCQPRDPDYHFGRIDRSFLESRDPGIRERIIFIFGPPAMVQAIDTLCQEIGCSKSMLKREAFIGY